MAKLDLRQILITLPIANAVISLSPQHDLTQFTMSKLPAGFGLNRIDSITALSPKEFDTLLFENPIMVKKAVNSKGNGLGVKIDHKLMQSYELMDGRHRLARAIAENKTTIYIKLI